jgi:transposase
MLKGKVKEKIKTGRLPAIPRLMDFGPGRSEKGGIDWYVYQIQVMPYLLDDYERFARKIGPEARLMQDGAPAHNSPQHQGIWEAWDIHFLPWVGNSPDLNPIEHIWDLIKRRIREKYPVLRNLRQLEQAWYDEWDVLSLEDINNAIEHQRTAIKRVVDYKGNNRFHG